MSYEFTSVCQSFTQAHAALANSTDEGAKTAHDRKVYAAIGKPYGEVKAFYRNSRNSWPRPRSSAKAIWTPSPRNITTARVTPTRGN